MSGIPVNDAKELAIDRGFRQVIIFGWDGSETHIATYGVTDEDCDQAATGANKIKANWGWPESTFVEPSRVQVLKNRILALEDELEKEVLQRMNGEQAGIPPSDGS